MPHLRVFRDVGPDPQFLIQLMKMRKPRGQTIPKVTQRIRTGLMLNSIFLAPQPSGKVTTSRPKGLLLMSAPGPGDGAPVRQSCAGSKRGPHLRG